MGLFDKEPSALIRLTEQDVEIIKEALFNLSDYSDIDDFDNFAKTYHKILEAEEDIENGKANATTENL